MVKLQSIQTILPSVEDSNDVSQESIQSIGTATALIRYSDFIILTDPNFSHRDECFHLGYGLRSQWLTELVLALDQSPPVDLVIRSWSQAFLRSSQSEKHMTQQAS